MHNEYEDYEEYDADEIIYAEDGSVYCGPEGRKEYLQMMQQQAYAQRMEDSMERLLRSTAQMTGAMENVAGEMRMFRAEQAWRNFFD